MIVILGHQLKIVMVCREGREGDKPLCPMTLMINLLHPYGFSNCLLGQKNIVVSGNPTDPSFLHCNNKHCTKKTVKLKIVMLQIDYNAA